MRATICTRTLQQGPQRSFRETSIRCCHADCQQSLTFRANNYQGTVPDVVMHKKAMISGWRKTNKGYLCPAHGR